MANYMATKSWIAIIMLAFATAKTLMKLVGRVGLEPTTKGL